MSFPLPIRFLPSFSKVFCSSARLRKWGNDSYKYGSVQLFFPFEDVFPHRVLFPPPTHIINLSDGSKEREESNLLLLRSVVLVLFWNGLVLFDKSILGPMSHPGRSTSSVI